MAGGIRRGSSRADRTQPTGGTLAMVHHAAARDRRSGGGLRCALTHGRAPRAAALRSRARPAHSAAESNRADCTHDQGCGPCARSSGSHTRTPGVHPASAGTTPAHRRATIRRCRAATAAWRQRGRRTVHRGPSVNESRVAAPRRFRIRALLLFPPWANRPIPDRVRSSCSLTLA